jgi:hypothetical protein
MRVWMEKQRELSDAGSIDVGSKGGAVKGADAVLQARRRSPRGR